jgi:hypothetical protein
MINFLREKFPQKTLQANTKFFTLQFPLPPNIRKTETKIEKSIRAG